MGENGRMSSTPDTATSPDPAAPQPRSRMRGNWHSLVLSMLAVGVVVLVLYAIVPRPDAVVQPPVDVTPVAQQVVDETGEQAWLPQLGEPGEPWKATSARYDRTPEGLRVFYAGYHRTDDDSVFVAVQQVPNSGAADAEALEAWTASAVSQGREDGTTSLDGASWTRYATGGDPARRGLVGDLDGTYTVVSGLADYETLEAVVSSMEPYGS